VFKQILQQFRQRRRRARIRALQESFGRIGEGVEFGETLHVEFPQRVYVGSYTYIGPWVKIYGRGGLIIGDNVMIAPEVLIMTSMHRYHNATMVPYDNVELQRPVSVRNGVWLGQRCILMPGVEIGEGCIIASGSVVTKTCATGEIVAGNPARVVGHRDMEHYWKCVQDDKLFLKVTRRESLTKEDFRIWSPNMPIEWLDRKRSSLSGDIQAPLTQPS
jgi:acetyltransferase-like isoleucine patch superfamily enzyme